MHLFDINLSAMDMNKNKKEMSMYFETEEQVKSFGLLITVIAAGLVAISLNGCYSDSDADRLLHAREERLKLDIFLGAEEE